MNLRRIHACQYDIERVRGKIDRRGEESIDNAGALVIETLSPSRIQRDV